jgi:serine/threonine protein phosphatase PrpC
VISSFYLNRNTDEMAALPVCGGVSVLWSRRCPTKATPNEDAAVALVVDDQTAVLAVADGVGGFRSGDVAAKVAVESLETALRAEASTLPAVRAAILNGIEQANQRILDLGIGAATTLAVLEINRRHVRPYHVGDSVILIFGARGKIKWQTTMHSPVGFAVEAGVLDAREALHHEDRHLVSNVVGSNDMRIEIGPSIRLAARDTVLLASDGLIDNLTVDEIVALLRGGSLDESIRRVSDAVRQRMLSPEPGHPSKPDDATILAFRPGTPRRATTTPAAVPAYALKPPSAEVSASARAPAGPTAAPSGDNLPAPADAARSQDADDRPPASGGSGE